MQTKMHTKPTKQIDENECFAERERIESFIDWLKMHYWMLGIKWNRMEWNRMKHPIQIDTVDIAQAPAAQM